jgi:hypothetical protein
LPKEQGDAARRHCGTQIPGARIKLLAAVSGAVFQAAPLGHGPFEVSITTLPLDNITLQVGHCTALMGFAKAAPDRAALLQLPLEGLAGLVLNGVAAQPRIVRAYGAGGEHLRASLRGSDFATLALRAESADDYLWAHINCQIYTDELCDALGVSVSSLTAAFRAVFVIIPHRSRSCGD